VAFIVGFNFNYNYTTNRDERYTDVTSKAHSNCIMVVCNYRHIAFTLLVVIFLSRGEQVQKCGTEDQG